MKHSRSFGRTALVAAVSAAAISTVAQEKDEDLDSLRLEAVIVTAQKRSQSAQDIGFSVNAFDANDAARFSGDIGSLAGQSPGVEAFGNNTGLQTVFIRGIGLNEFASNFNQPVAMHRDEVYVTKSWMVARPTFDLDRVEILKGPQGTLFGRNTIGGAVNYYNAAPTQELEAYVRVKGDEHERYSVEGAVSGGSDLVSGRLSVYRGFGNGGPQFNVFDGEEHGEPDVTEVRGQLQFDMESTSVKVLAYAGEDKTEMTAFKSPGIFNPGGGFCDAAISGQTLTDFTACTKFGGLGALVFGGQYGSADSPLGPQDIEVAPADAFTINQNAPNVRDDEFAGGYVRVEQELNDSMQLVVLGSYDTYEQNTVNDSDSSPIFSAEQYGFNDIEATTLELRLVGSTDNLDYVAGFFGSYDKLETIDSIDLTQNPASLSGLVPNAPPPGLFGEYEQEVRSYAFFGNVDFQVTDSLLLSFGARYTEDETDIEASSSVDAGAPFLIPISLATSNAAAIAAASAINPNLIVLNENNRTDDNFSWRVGATYDVNDSSIAYFNATTGFRTGGYSVPFGGEIVDFEPEEITSFEIGYKTELTPAVRLNVAAFMYQYEDYQVNVDDPGSPLVPLTRNIDEAETVGFEADLTWLVTQDLDIKAGYSYLDAEFSDTDRSIATYANVPGGIGSVPLEGNSPVNSPENQWNVSANYATEITQSLGFSATLDYRWVDDRFLEATNQPSDVAESYGVLNASIGLFDINETWSVSVWGRNLTNEEYLTYLNNIPNAGFNVLIFGEQRTIGMSADYHF